MLEFIHPFMIMIPKADMQKWIGRFGGLHISRRTASTTLLLIFAASVCLIYRLDPKRLFGQYQDDTLYMGAALALAEDRGYLIPSLPNTPVQTKYPVFFPWILSLPRRGGFGAGTRISHPTWIRPWPSRHSSLVSRCGLATA